MGISTSKQKTTSNETTSGSTTPTNPAWVTGAAQEMVNRASAVGNNNPYDFVAGINPTLEAANTKVNNLGGWQSGLNTAMDMTKAAGTPYTAATYTAPTLSPASQATAQGYTAAQAEAAQIAENERAQAALASSASMLDGGLDRYLNPNTQALVNTTLADYDENAARQAAQYRAQGAANGAFGGSRFGIGEASLAGEQGRGRAATDANVRNTAFLNAVQMAQYDATNRQNTSLNNSQVQTGVNTFNAGQTNQRNQAQAALQNSTNLFNTGAQNEAAAFGANANNQASLFNAGQSNNFALSQAQLNAGAGQFNAGAANDASRFNAGQSLAAAGQMGQLANSQAANSRGDAQLAADLGMNMQQLAQMRAQAPLEFEKLVSGLYGSAPYSLFQGQDVTGKSSGTGTVSKTGSLLDGIGQAISIGGKAASLFSDRRLKTDIRKVGEFADGLGIYDYAYIWGERMRGVMADEVATLRPWALGEPVNGFATVNYGAL